MFAVGPKRIAAWDLLNGQMLFVLPVPTDGDWTLFDAALNPVKDRLYVVARNKDTRENRPPWE